MPADFRLRDHLGREAWRLGEDEATRGQVRGFRVRQLDPFLRWCLSFRGQVRPVAPEQVVDGFRGLARRVLALYQTEGEEN